MKRLGLDIGTNSIGWAIIDEKNEKKHIQNCGVYIFPEGVKIEKGVESSKAAERTAFRSARRLKFRRKLRKYETLKVLAQNKMCPLSLEELEKWRKENIYPSSPDFIQWYRTDELKHWEPYFLRKKCTEEKAEPYEIGRALYHIAQRRGFLSNRKETTKENEKGKVKTAIDDISAKKGEKTLGQYFYELKQSGEKVRARYTSRKAHYEEEFNRMCEVQNSSAELKAELHRAIFFQRKLKSQKFLVGKCTFEPNKPRCPVSHFEFEEFRMLSFINSIKVARNVGETDRQEFEFLSDEEKTAVKELFFRVSKPSFNFKDIAKKLKGKNEYWMFNYRDDTNVAGCPVSAKLKKIFGDGWRNIQIGQYDVNDIWHVLFDFDDDEKLFEFAKDKLLLDEKTAEEFKKISFPQGYASLSLKAVRKMLPFLHEGHLYTNAAFLANIPTVIGQDNFDKNKETIVNKVLEISKTIDRVNLPRKMANICLEMIYKDNEHDFRSEAWNRQFLDICIKNYIGNSKWNNRATEEQSHIMAEAAELIEDMLKSIPAENHFPLSNFTYPMKHIDELIMDYLVQEGYQVKNGKKIYHPLQTESKYNLKLAEEKNGRKFLSSPMTSSIRNPVVMRALHQLRKLVNYLIKTGEIDEATRVHVELANEVNDKNWRKAIEEYQREREKENSRYKAEIIQTTAESGQPIQNPTESDIKKYRLWKEQNEECPYTGKHISFSALFGCNAQFDFEHTIPRSISYDDSLENLTLCDSHFNRNVKKQQIPSQLADYDEIARRFERYYTDKLSDCLDTIERNKTRGISDPELKDRMIVKRHVAELKKNYYVGKLKRFKATEITQGFKNSQLNDTRMITKFALSYLKTVFEYVMPVNGTATDTFKRQWNVLGRDDKKDRSINTHHAVDAIVIAAVDKWKYDLLCRTIHESPDGKSFRLQKPWDTFSEDVQNATRHIIPKIYSDDNALRQTKKVLKDKDGKPKLKNGKKQYIQGNTVRGSLHKDTFYGCIMAPPEKGGESKKIFVQTLPCSALDEKAAEKIIDKGIKRAFFDNIQNGIQTPEEIKQNGIKLPYQINGRDVYAKKIRIEAKPKNPIRLKNHRDASSKDYKRPYYVVNEENYVIASYRSINAKGKEENAYEVRSLLDVSKCRINNEPLYPTTKEKNGTTLNLYKTYKIGQIIILKENEEDDVFAMPDETIWKNIYSVRGIVSNSQIKLNHVSVSSAWENSKEELEEGVRKFKLITVSQIRCLAEGSDFRVLPTGKIERI